MAFCCIVIPIYKEKPDKYEIRSIKQCLNVLRAYPIYLAVPSKLDTSCYERLLKDQQSNLHFERFANHFFEGINGYNRLMLNEEFYLKFLSYRYILIYQLDAYVFYDKLDYWCSKGLDYLGAPIPYGLIHDVETTHNTKHNDNIKIPHAYNGGVSLRKVTSFIKTIEKNEDIISNWFVKGLNEDIIFSSLLLQNCEIPGTEALQFCIDNFPRESVAHIGGHLPMFCHGWTKLSENSAEYDGMFWMKHIWKWQYWKLSTQKRIQRKIKSCLHR